jgi:hypothetical protein
VSEAVLRCSVWDANLVAADRRMGVAALRLADVLDGQPHAVELPLQEDYAQGRLLLQVGRPRPSRNLVRAGPGALSLQRSLCPSLSTGQWHGRRGSPAAAGRVRVCTTAMRNGRRLASRRSKSNLPHIPSSPLLKLDS